MTMATNPEKKSVRIINNHISQTDIKVEKIFMGAIIQRQQTCFDELLVGRY